MLKSIFKCHFNNPNCNTWLGCKCGKGGSTTIQAPAAPDQGEIARENVQAQIKYSPEAARVSYDILANPEYGLYPTTQLYQQTREGLFPQETQVRDQLAQNIFGNLSATPGEAPTQEQGLQNIQQLQNQFFPQNQLLQNQYLMSTLQNLENPMGTEGEQVQALTEQQNVMNQLYPEQQQLMQGLSQSMESLQSPTGLTPEQQAAMDAIRQEQVDKMQRDIQTSSNVGGSLYGGRRINREDDNLRQMRQSFAAEDIDRQAQARQQAIQNAQSILGQFRGMSDTDIARQQSARQAAISSLAPALSTFSGLSEQAMGREQSERLEAQNRQEREQLNAIQAALPFLQILYPEIGITAPQFQSPVPGANTAYQGAVQTNAQGLQAQMANQQAQQQMQQAMWGALGQTAGGLASTATFMCWVAAEIFGGWEHPKTVAARFYIRNMAPKWFREFYRKHGEKIAEFISDKLVLKLMLRPLFEVFAIVGAHRNICVCS